MLLVEKHIIKASNRHFKEIDKMSFLSKNLFNSALYICRQAHPTSNQYLAILEEIFSAEIESDSDPKVVYPILEKHQDQLDLNFAETLTQWFQSALDPNNSDRNQDLASLLFNFANKIQQFPLGSRADNLEIAIASYQAALEVYSYWFYGQISKQPA